MPEIAPVQGQTTACGESGERWVSEKLALALLLYCLARGSEAVAGDTAGTADRGHSASPERIAEFAIDAPSQHPAGLGPAPGSGTAGTANNFPATVSLESLLTAPPLTQQLLAEPPFPATVFRPRRSSILLAAPDQPANFRLDASTLRTTTVWQEMGQFRSQDRLRLLTLWESRGSTLSLQAGRRGGPSLQWSTPWVFHQGQTHAGLLDRLFSVPAHGVGSSFYSNPPARVSSPPPSKLTEAAGPSK